MGAVLLASLGAFIVAAHAKAAHAAVRARAGGYLPVSGPRLAGDSVLWVKYRRDGGYDLFEKSPRNSPRVLLSVPEREPDHAWLTFFAASAQRVLVQQRRYVKRSSLKEDPPVPEALAGPREGPFTRVAGPCTGIGLAQRRVDVSNGVGIFPAGCGDGARTRDFGPGGVSRLIPSADEFGVSRIAGRYAAWQDRNGPLVVYDWVKGDTAYTVPGPFPGKAGPLELDVQEDGKLVVAYRALVSHHEAHATRVAWASSSAPSLHFLPLRRRFSYHVQISGDRIAYIGTPGQDDVTSRGVLGVTDLAGRARRVASSVHVAYPFDDNLALDGGRLAWVQSSCRGPEIREVDVGTLRRAIRPRRCALRLSRRPRLSRSRRLVLTVDCHGLYKDCRTVSGVVRLARRYDLRGVRRARGARITKGDPATRGRRIALRLSRAGRALLRGKRHLRVVLSVRLTATSGVAATEVRRTRLVLRRR